LKDPERGLIDFYSEREGRVVYLCYLLGEPDLLYWHDLDTGFAAASRCSSGGLVTPASGDALPAARPALFSSHATRPRWLTSA
jgi:hypothetical protein